MCLWSNLSYIPLGISLGVGLLDHKAGLCLDFKKPPNFFPECLHQLAFSPAVYKGSFFPTSSPIPVGGVFDDGYSNRGEVES
jgi:hypothetical protein